MDNDCPSIRDAAAAGPKSRWAGMLDQTGAPDCSGSNLCGCELAGGFRDPPLRGNFGHGRYDGRRSHETDSVSPHAMKGPEIAVGAALSGRPSAAEERFSCHPVGEGLAPPAGFRNFFGRRWVFALRGGAPGRRALRTLWSTKDGRLHGSAPTAFQANHGYNRRG